jgi:twitching motility protein PilT
MELIDILKVGLAKNASDLHLSAGLVPMLRVDGDITPLTEFPALEADGPKNLLDPYLTDLQRQAFDETHDLDFSFGVDAIGRRFRVNMFHQLRGTSAALRYIPDTVPTLEELQAPPVFKTITDDLKGLVLVTGPTGSGKSTTLAAMVDYINRSRKEHVLTIEDPIEFVHTPNQCIIDQRELHQHTESFSSALRSALREDPDIILVGELRDVETIRLALTAAETGHLVFATLHTSSAPTTINRIIDVFPGNEKSMVRTMLSESLNSVIAQTLVKRKDGGRCAIHEVMRCTSGIRNLIREDKVTQIYSAIQTGAAQGMITQEQSIAALVAKGILAAGPY